MYVYYATVDVDADSPTSCLTFLRSDLSIPSVHKVARKIYNWYASCTNKTERDRLGPTPLLELIHQTMKSKEFTPFVIHQWPEGEWSVEETLASVHRKLGVSPLFKVSLDMDPRNSSSPTHLAVTKKCLSFPY